MNGIKVFLKLVRRQREIAKIVLRVKSSERFILRARRVASADTDLLTAPTRCRDTLPEIRIDQTLATAQQLFDQRRFGFFV